MSEFPLSSSFQNLACSLSQIKEKRQVLRRLYHEHFLPVFEDWIENLDKEKQESEKKVLITLEEKLKEDDMTVAFSGPNDSGKSTLINAILGKKICFAIEGRGTFRMMVIRYADIENDMIRSTLMKEDGTTLEVHEGKTIPDKFQKRPQDLEEATVTTTQIETREERMRELNQHWILVELNHPLLKCGLTLIDLPGLAEMHSLTQSVKKFIQKRKPTTIFVNSDASFLETTVQCLTTIIDALEEPELLNLFYVSNKFDSMLYEEEDKNLLIWRRYQGFCQKPSTLTRLSLDEAPKILELPNFACISALEAFRQTRNHKKTDDLFESFLGKLENYLVYSAEVDLSFCRRKLRSINNSFFHDGPAKIKYSPEDLYRMAEEAKSIEERMKTELSLDLSEWEKKTKAILVQDADEIEKAVRQKARTIGTTFDGSKVSSDQAKEAAILIKEKVENLLQTEIAERISPCLKELGSTLTEKFQDYAQLISRENNFFLNEGIENGYNVNLSVLQKTAFTTGGVTSIFAIGAGIGASIVSTTFWTGIGLIVGGSILLASVVLGIGAFVWKKLSKHEIDEKFKIDVANKILEHLPEIIDKTIQLTKNHVQDKIEEGHKGFQESIKEKLENMKKYYEQMEKDIEQMRDFSQRFSSVESRLLAWDNLGLPNPEFGKKLGSESAFGKVYRASWKINNNNNDPDTVAIKVFNEMSHRSYFEIVIHSMIGINQRGILPFYGAILKENADIFSERPEICFAMPLMKFDLQTVIKDRLFITPQQRLHIALDIAYGLENMFSIVRIIHRDLKPENVLIDEIGNAFLADFGIAQINDFQRSIAGTAPYMPPETLFEGRKSQSADIYSFGILLWCLIPENIQKIEDLPEPPFRKKPPVVNSSSLGNEYQNLMDKCWDNSEEKRPKITEVIAALEKIIDVI